MGCGCKNKGNQTPPPPQANTTANSSNPQLQQESVKSAIKKTIEKYYNVGKTKGTNGWIKE